MLRSKIFSPRGSMSISPEPGKMKDSPDYKNRSKSKSRSPNHKRHNGYARSGFYKKNRKEAISYS